LAGLKADHATLTIVVGKIGVPAHAKVQGQVLVHSPVVLDEKPPLRPLQRFELAAALRKAGRLAHQIIRHTFAGNLTVEAEIAHHLKGVADVVGKPNDFPAKLEIVSPVNLGHHFPDRPTTTVEGAVMTRTDTEATRDVEV